MKPTTTTDRASDEIVAQPRCLLLAACAEPDALGEYQEVDCRHWDYVPCIGDDVPHWGGDAQPLN
jgi:hypothetical protein